MKAFNLTTAVVELILLIACLLSSLLLCDTKVK